MHPHADKQAILDTIRFAGVFVFLIDWCMKLAYVMRSKYAIIQIRDLYVGFIFWRIRLVAIYHVVLISLQFHRAYFLHTKDMKKKGYNELGVLNTEE